MQNKTYKENFLTAGKLAKEVRSFGKSLIKQGSSYNEIITQVRKKIQELGAIPAFPPQIALNHVAAHFLPEPGQDIILTDQMVKLDIGVCYEGSLGDCAVTVDLSGKHQALIEAAEAALLAAEQSLKVGLTLGEVGRTIESTIKSHGFNPIKNLCGHGLGYYQIHTDPIIPNYDDKSCVLIKPGMTFAIEPFATTGRGFIEEKGVPTLFSLIKKRKAPSPSLRQLLEKIQAFNDLPFAIHDLLDEKSSITSVKKGLFELLKAGIIAGYGPLVEKEGTLVAQAENSVLVDEEGNIYVSTR